MGQQLIVSMKSIRLTGMNGQIKIKNIIIGVLVGLGIIFGIPIILTMILNLWVNW